jgi:hypothetical protein
MTPNQLPKDSLLQNLLTYMSSTEVPLSYTIAGGLSVIGAILRRQRWIDQMDWRVYPNQSILFIGPSGVGKDTAINKMQKFIGGLTPLTRVPVIGGTTLEGLHTRLAELPKPAAAYIPAPEITAFFGKSDYQANMLTGITNLLSNGEAVDITTKGSFLLHHTPTVIYQPTLTLHGGSTVEWLHKGMPEGTLEGGFMGRFLIVIEEIGSKFIPLVKRDMTQEKITFLRGELQKWEGGLEYLVRACGKGAELILLPEAEDLYANWYYNRFKIFSRAVMPYANRSRDMVLRLAMLMALSRRHLRWVDGEDMQFAIDLIGEVAKKIDAVVLPPSAEAQVAQKILDLLPATPGEIYTTLGLRYSLAKQIDPALALLRATGRIEQKGKVIQLAT